MIFKQLFDMESCTYTYFVASGYGREAVIIDPVEPQLEQYMRLITELGVKLVAAIDTHVHADHITALGTLRERTNCASMLGEQTKAECVSVRLKENQHVNFDGLALKPVYTPGHTDDSYSYLMGNCLFSGDTLLIRGSGRTDFQNGNAYDQYHSIFHKLLTLPEDTLVYPGHDYRGNTVSSIWEEKHFNPRLQVRSADEYAELMANLNLPNPRYMDVAVPANLKCGLS